MDNKYFCVIILFVGLCHGVSRASECTARGRFPSDGTGDCRGYTMCLLGGITNYTQYKLMCPIGSVYSHLKEQCTNETNYKCSPTYNCTDVGSFVNNESKDCSSYIVCIQGLGGIDTARLEECPSNTLFSSTANACVNNTQYTCNYNDMINNADYVKFSLLILLSLLIVTLL